MLIPFPVPQNQPQAFTVTTESLVNAGFLPGDEITVNPHAAPQVGDWVLVEVDSLLMLRRYDRFCRRIIGRVESLHRKL